MSQAHKEKSYECGIDIDFNKALQADQDVCLHFKRY